MGGTGPAHRGARLRHRDDARSFRRPVRADAGAPGDPQRHDHAAGMRARLRQRLQAPARAREGAGHDGRALRGSRRDRSRRRVDDRRLRAGRHDLRSARSAHRPLRRGPRGHQGRDGRRAVLVRGRALHDPRTRRFPEADPGATSTGDHRWRRQTGPRGRSPRSRHRGGQRHPARRRDRPRRDRDDDHARRWSTRWRSSPTQPAQRDASTRSR